MTNAVIYARRSTDKQTEQSIDGQIRVCREYADRMGFAVVQDYIDRGISGRKDDRPEFQRMIADAEKMQFEYVIVYKLDRFSRDRYHSAIYKMRLKKCGVRVLSATEQLSDSPESLFLEAMLEAHAEYFSRELAQKVRRGMRESALKSNSVGGAIPLGYKIGPDKKLQIVEDEAKAVRLIFEMYGGGKGKQEIVNALNSQGFRTRKKQPFNKHSFTTILTNRKYFGEYVYDGETTGKCPAIITKEMFDKVQQVVEGHRKAPSKGRRVDYMLTGKLFCGHCGEPMGGMSGKSATKETHLYYACHGRRKHKNCKKKHELKAYLEWYVVEQVQQWLSEKTIKKLATEIYSLYENELGKSELRRVEKRIAETEKALENIVNLIAETGSRSLIGKLEALELEADELQEQRASLLISSKVVLSVDQIIEWIKKFKKGEPTDPSYQKAIIDSLINAIFLYDDRIVIYFNLGKEMQVSYIEHIQAEYECISEFALDSDRFTSRLCRPTICAHSFVGVFSFSPPM